MTDDDNRQIDDEIVDQDRQAELPILADAVLADLDLEREIHADEQHDETIGDCEADCVALGWPKALAKAAWDPFIYAAGLRSGAVVVFEEAAVAGPGWVRLEGVRAHTVPGGDNDYAAGSFSFARGVEVRLEEIIWVADAPYGS